MFSILVIIILVSIPVALYFSVLLSPSSLPSDDELHRITNPEASEVYSSDGKLIGKYFIQNRKALTLKDISVYIVDALIATEDVRFYRHKGIDWKSMPRVAIKSIIFGNRSGGGGSTITQQLAKNIYPRIVFTHFSLVKNKIREMIIASRLEKIYSKQEILTLYLNTVPFGENVFGIETASQRFFDKPAKKLNVQEAAVLVGMLKATSWYNPRNHPDRAIGRRNVVIGQMQKAGDFTLEYADSLKELPLRLHYKRKDENNSLAPYVTEQVRQKLLLLLPKISDSLGVSLNIYTDGLKIYTGIDATMQKYAQRAVHSQMAVLQKKFEQHWQNMNKPWENDRKLINRLILQSASYRQLKSRGWPEDSIMRELNRTREMKIFTWNGPKTVNMNIPDSIKYYLGILNAGFVAMAPSNGRILAWVGGIDYEYFKYDHVNENTKRQVGSTFKPIVYAAALEEGISPCRYIEAEQKTFEENGKQWTPANAGGEYEGKYSMEGALTESVNTVSVKILEETGIDNAITLAGRMGISSPIPNVPSIALGTPSISLLEMTAAYCTFVNGGRAVKPWLLERIEDKKGNILWQRKNERARQVMSKKTAQMMLQMLKNVVNNGTGKSLRTVYHLNNDLAGKTGTTQHNADGWFMGITPGLVTGTWVGGEYPVVHFRTTALGQGAKTALPVFAAFLHNMNSDREKINFTRARFSTPPEQLLKELDCDPFKEELSFFEWLFGKKDKEKKKADREKKIRQKKPKKTDKKTKGKKGLMNSLKKFFKGKKN